MDAARAPQGQTRERCRGPWPARRVTVASVNTGLTFPNITGLKVRDPSAELAARRDQGLRAGMGDGKTVDQASPDDLPEKQEAARGRPLATYVRAPHILRYLRLSPAGKTTSSQRKSTCS